MDIIPGIILDPKESEIPVVKMKVLPGKDYGEMAFIGDFHVASGNFSLSQYLHYLCFIKSHKLMKVALMGDYIDLGQLSPYGAAVKQIASLQLWNIIRLLEPIKKQIILMLEGNHEERFWKATKGVDTITRSIADALQIDILLPGPERGQLFVVEVSKGKKKQYYPVYATHGSTASTTLKSTQLRKIYANIRVPLVAHGHIHQLYKDHKTFYSVRQKGDRFYTTCNEQHWLTTGCFVKNLGYAEKKSMPVTRIGAPFVRFYATRVGLEIIDDARITYGIGIKSRDPAEMIRELRMKGIEPKAFNIEGGFGGTRVIFKPYKKWEEKRLRPLKKSEEKETT